MTLTKDLNFFYQNYGTEKNQKKSKVLLQKLKHLNKMKRKISFFL